MRFMLWLGLAGLAITSFAIGLPVLLYGTTPSQLLIAGFFISVAFMVVGAIAYWHRFKTRDPELARLVGQAVWWGGPALYWGVKIARRDDD